MIQRRKNIRHNCCILNNIIARTGDASIWNQQEQPFNSPIILDIEGHRGLPYRVLRLTNGLFVAGGCALEERMVCIPRDGKAIRSFLERGHMSALLRVKAEMETFNSRIAAAVDEQDEKVGFANMMGRRLEMRTHAVFYTPSKRYGRTIQNEQPKDLLADDFQVAIADDE